MKFNIFNQILNESPQDFFNNLDEEFAFIDTYSLNKYVSILDIFSMKQIMQYFIPLSILEKITTPFEYIFDQENTSAMPDINTIVSLNEQIDFDNISLQDYVITYENILTYHSTIVEFLQTYFALDEELSNKIKTYTKMTFESGNYTFTETLNPVIKLSLKDTDDHFFVNEVKETIKKQYRISYKKIVQYYRKENKIFPLLKSEININMYLADDNEEAIKIYQNDLENFLITFNQKLLTFLCRNDEYNFVNQISMYAKDVIDQYKQDPTITHFPNIIGTHCSRPTDFKEIYNGLINTLLIMKCLNENFKENLKEINNLIIDRMIKNLYIIVACGKNLLKEVDVIGDNYLEKYFPDNEVNSGTIYNITGMHKNPLYKQYSTIIKEFDLNKFCSYNKTYQVSNATVLEKRRKHKYIVDFNLSNQDLFYSPKLLDILLDLSHYINKNCKTKEKYISYFINKEEDKNFNRTLYELTTSYLITYFNSETDKFSIAYLKNLIIGLVKTGKVDRKDTFKVHNLFQTFSCLNHKLYENDTSSI